MKTFLGKKLRMAGLAVALAAGSFAALPEMTSAAPSEPYTWKSVVTGAGGGFVP